MGRQKINQSIKKRKLSITISICNYNKFEEFNVKNKSKLIEWLLNNHFDKI